MLTKIQPHNDPWDPLHSLHKHGKHMLTSVELTLTNLCNMRCEHCAVGDVLVMTETGRVPLEQVLHMLDQVKHLETISITGGEPTYHAQTVDNYLIPVLKYARERGLKSQLNSNITLPLSRYEAIAPYLDVLHISYNYADAKDFYDIGFANAARPVTEANAMKLYEQMVSNAKALSKGGLFVSAETMINYRTHQRLPDIHRTIVEMGCARHEVHPMYPSAFAAHLPVLTLDEYRNAVHQLLDARDAKVWMLFGTLPFFSCSSSAVDRELVKRLQHEPNVTVRNDPDGRNRLNVNLFTGEVYVTDFSDLSSFGSMHTERLDDIFSRWQEHPLYRSVNCHCPESLCCGPNLLVKDMYYRDIDFTVRKAFA